VTLAELLGLCRAHWLRLLAGLVLGAGAGAVAGFVLPSWYRAALVLAPAAELTQSAGGLASLASRFGGLASIAGIDLGASSTDRSAVTLETLRGHKFLVDFAKRRELVVPLLAGSGYDPVAKKWSIDPRVYDEKAGAWQWRGLLNRRKEPTDFEIYKKLSKRIYVDEDRKNGMIRMAVEARSPVAAAEWASLLVRDLNDYLRRKDTEEAKRTIGYLEQQIRQTPVAEMQSIFYRLIEEQTKTLMLAQVRDEYALKLVDPPLVPDRPAFPNRVLLFALGGIGGAALAFLTVLLFPSRNVRRTG
jgi:hypothetical protein